MSGDTARVAIGDGIIVTCDGYAITLTTNLNPPHTGMPQQCIMLSPISLHALIAAAREWGLLDG